jgi:hypothetical protein
MSVCARLCRTRQNCRDTTADDLKNQPLSHHRQLLGHPDCCCRARRSPPVPRFPHRTSPRGFLLGRFSNAGRYRSQPEPARRGPHRKTFTQAEVRSPSVELTPMTLSGHSGYRPMHATARPLARVLSASWIFTTVAKIGFADLQRFDCEATAARRLKLCPASVVVGCEGQLEKGARARAGARRYGGHACACLPPSEGSRSIERRILVSPLRRRTVNLNA